MDIDSYRYMYRCVHAHTVNIKIQVKGSGCGWTKQHTQQKPGIVVHIRDPRTLEVKASQKFKVIFKA